jgi:hypothetical protein
MSIPLSIPPIIGKIRNLHKIILKQLMELVPQETQVVLKLVKILILCKSIYDILQLGIEILSKLSKRMTLFMMQMLQLSATLMLVWRRITPVGKILEASSFDWTNNL